MARSGSRLVRLSPVAVCVGIAGCVQAGDPPRVVEGASPPGDTVTVTGVLTDEGIECQAVRGDDGELYTLAGDLEGFELGDRVRVEGRVAEMSFCMQGTTLGVQRIEHR